MTNIAALLPFYPTCALKSGALRWRNRLVVLDWTNEPFYQLNAAGALCLTPTTAGQYAKFFFDHVRGDDGCFTLVEPGDPIAWLPSASIQHQEAVNNLLQPVTYQGYDAEGLHRLTATVIFSNYAIAALFRSSFRIAPRVMPVFDAATGGWEEFCCGQIRLGDDEDLLIEELHVTLPQRLPLSAALTQH